MSEGFHSTIYAACTIYALHHWAGAPDGIRDYLRHPHRHSFRIKAWADVEHNDRDIEFHDFQQQLSTVVHRLADTRWAEHIAHRAMSLNISVQEAMMMTVGQYFDPDHFPTGDDKKDRMPDFGSMSCEMIGEAILRLLPHINRVEVAEDVGDGEEGGSVEVMVEREYGVVGRVQVRS